MPYGVALHVAPGNPQWRIPFGIQIIPGGMLFLGSFILKESPRWLASRGHTERALANLCWLRNLPSSHTYVEDEMFEIEEAIRRDVQVTGPGIMGPMKTLFRSRSYLYRLLLGIMLFAMQNGTGINAINVSYDCSTRADSSTTRLLCSSPSA